MSTDTDSPADIPDALKPVYQTRYANSPIRLYEGIVKVHRDDTVFTGKGSVHANWSPRPKICFEVNLAELVDPCPLSSAKVELVDEAPDKLVDADITRTSVLFARVTTAVSGDIDTWEHNPGAEVHRIVFHLPNFRDYRGETVRNGRSVWAGRLTLAFADWSIAIDKISDNDFWKELKATGSFGITHVGSLVRQDGKSFSLTDAKRCLEGLYWFLSFCNGRWTGPVLLIGYDEDCKPLSHEWDMPRLSPHRTVFSWFADNSRHVASEVYPGFAARWADETWTLATKNAIYWYMMGNAPGVAIENGVIVAHVAFETLGWTLFVEDSKALSTNGYCRLEAADKLRLLLNHCRIALDVPDELPSLKAAVKADNWVDGPGALASVRNAYVHPSTKNRDRLSRAGNEAEHEAWNLSMYYLELILLHLFDYQGVFSNRLRKGGLVGQAEMPVPWAT